MGQRSAMIYDKLITIIRSRNASRDEIVPVPRSRWDEYSAWVWVLSFRLFYLSIENLLGGMPFIGAVDMLLFFTVSIFCKKDKFC